MYSINTIATIIGPASTRLTSEAQIDQILLDSRKLLFPSRSLFFALNGTHRTGSEFVSELYQRGVMNFVVEQDFPTHQMEPCAGANFLLVADVLHALHLLAIHHRNRFSIPVIGITGSNGKTIVKEWLYHLLQADFDMVRSPKSYNSQIGVPLSVWQMNANHTLGIFEAGISKPGEMAALEKIIQPGIGIFTNIGDAHNEGFSGMIQKIREKLNLFLHSQVLVYCSDDDVLNDTVVAYVQEFKSDQQVSLFTWGKNHSAIIKLVSVEVSDQHTELFVRYQGRELQFSIPFTDEASIENAMHGLTVLLYLKIDPAVIAQRLLHLAPVEMRLELKQGINNCSVINDSYSADLHSLTIALDFLSQQQQHVNRTVILSDLLQTGKKSAALYEDIALMLIQKNVNRFIGIGTEISRYQDAFREIKEKTVYLSTSEFIQQFPALHFSNETILLKGARMFEFEQISHLLEQKVHQTLMEINLNALTHNLKVYQSFLKPGVKMMAMVKAFSYGTGGFEVANLMQFHKVDYLAVAYADEGVELRKAGITLPIMVMNAEASTFDVLVHYNLEPELYSFPIFQAFEKYINQSAIQHYPVHIKVDTGMHRLGFEKNDMVKLGNLLSLSASFKVQSVFSHLASSDNDAHDQFTKLQAEIFIGCCEFLTEKLGYDFIRHIANTSAIHRHPELQMDIVRLGIGLYGVDATPAVQQQLMHVATLKTTVAQIKTVARGESIGYNLKGVAQKDSVIATVRIGYADGYPRHLSNGKGKMWLNGHLVPVIGNVCMDMVMLDITGIEATEGDDVIVFGKELPVRQVAAWAETISYEILTGISQRVKRVYYEE